jgi:alcohol dehydrogenase class IV
VLAFFDVPAAPAVSVMSWPTRVLLGAGALARLGEEVRALGVRRPLVVTDRGVVATGIAGQVEAALSEAGLRPSRHDGIHANPTDADATEGLAAYRAADCDGIVAVGGGSAIDGAKLVALLVNHPGPLSRYDDAAGGDRFVTGELPPLVAIPTTAGTGSEVGRSAVATLPDTGRKTVIFSPRLMPRAAICDPALTVGLPRTLTAWTGMDALTHSIEAYVAAGFHPLADAVALDGIRRVARALPVAARDGADLAARTDMMVAAMEGAMAFQKGLGASHALAHALTPLCGVHHGLANAIALATVCAFNVPAATARLARVAVALGEPDGAPDDVLAARAVERVEDLAREVGIPRRLRDAGVREEALPAVAAKAFEDASHRTNPRPCSEADLLALARAAW